MLVSHGLPGSLISFGHVTPLVALGAVAVDPNATIANLTSQCLYPT